MPQVTIIAGANGSGKPTVAPYLLPRQTVYLNADEFAKELKAGGAVNADISAGRLLLERWEALTEARADFAVETTLATRSFAPRLKAMQSAGYHFQLIFLWTPNAEFAMERVKERVRHGGHSIPDDVIQRRYAAGLRDFFGLYQPFADTWQFFDNTRLTLPVPVADSVRGVQNNELWRQLQTEWS